MQESRSSKDLPIAEQILTPNSIKQPTSQSNNKSRKRIGQTGQSSGQYLRRPGHLQPFRYGSIIKSVKKSTCSKKLDKLLSLMQQVVQSADNLSTYSDEKRSIQEKFALQLYFSDRQNLQQFMDAADYKFCEQVIAKNGTSIANFLQVTSQQSEKDVRSARVIADELEQARYVSQGVDKELKNRGVNFFNFHSLAYCGPYFKTTAKESRHHSTTKVVDLEQKESNTRKKGLSIVNQNEKSRSNSASVAENTQPQFKKEQIDFEIQRILLQMRELEKILDELNRIKTTIIVQEVALIPAEKDTKYREGQATQTRDAVIRDKMILRDNWYVLSSDNNPRVISPMSHQQRVHQQIPKIIPQNNRQFSFGPVMNLNTKRQQQPSAQPVLVQQRFQPTTLPLIQVPHQLAAQIQQSFSPRVRSPQGPVIVSQPAQFFRRQSVVPHHEHIFYPQDASNRSNESTFRRVLIEYKTPDHSIQSRSKQVIQQHHPSIGYPLPIAEQKKTKKINKIESGTICSTICGSKLPWNPQTQGKSSGAELVSTLHRDSLSPAKDFDTSINYTPSLVPAPRMDVKRNVEPELRFYPSEGAHKREQEPEQEKPSQKEQLSKEQVPKVSVPPVKEEQKPKSQVPQLPVAVPFKNVEGRIRYSAEKQNIKILEDKQVQTQSNDELSIDTHLKDIPSNPMSANELSPTVNLIPSVIVEESVSVVENERSLVEKENLPTIVSKQIVDRDTHTIQQAVEQEQQIASQKQTADQDVQTIEEAAQAQRVLYIQKEIVSEQVKVDEKKPQPQNAVKIVTTVHQETQTIEQPQEQYKVINISLPQSKFPPQESIKIDIDLPQNTSPQISLKDHEKQLADRKTLIDNLRNQILKIRQRKSNLEQQKDLFKFKVELYENKHCNLNDNEINQLKIKIKHKEMERAIRKQQEETDQFDRLGVEKGTDSRQPSRENSPARDAKIFVEIPRREPSPKRQPEIPRINHSDQRDDSLSGTQLRDLTPIPEKRRTAKKQRKPSQNLSDQEIDLSAKHGEKQAEKKEQLGAKKIATNEPKQEPKQQQQPSQQSAQNSFNQQKPNFQYPFPFPFPQVRFNQQGYPQGFNPMAFYPTMPQNPIVNNIYVNGSGATKGTPTSNVTNPLDERILKKIESMEQQILQNNNSIKALEFKLNAKGSKIKSEKAVTFDHKQSRQFLDEDHDDRSEQIRKLKEELKELRRVKEKQNNELNAKIEELKRILKRERDLLNEKSQQLLEIRSKSADKVPTSTTLQVPGVQNNQTQKAHDHKKCEEAFKLYKDSLMKKDEVNKKLKERLKQLTDLINKDRDTLKNLQKHYKIEAEKNKALKDELRTKDGELIRFKNQQIKKIVEQHKRAQQKKSDTKFPSIQIHHRPDMSVVRQQQNESSQQVSKSQRKSQEDNQSLGISNRRKKSQQPNGQVVSTSQRGVTNEQLMMLENRNQEEIEELKRRVNELEIQWRGVDREGKGVVDDRRQIQESKIDISPHVENETKKLPTLVHTRLNYNYQPAEQSRIVFDDFSDEDAFDPVKIPQFISKGSQIKPNEQENSILGEFYDPSYHQERKEFEQEMEAAKNRIFSLSTKENDLKALRDRIEDLEKKERVLEDLERDLKEFGYSGKMQDVPKVINLKDEEIRELKRQLDTPKLVVSQNVPSEQLNELKQKLSDKQNEINKLKKQLAVSVVIGQEDQSQDNLTKIKDKIKEIPSSLLLMIRSVVMGDGEVTDGKKVKQLQEDISLLKSKIQELQIAKIDGDKRNTALTQQLQSIKQHPVIDESKLLQLQNTNNQLLQQLQAHKSSTQKQLKQKTDQLDKLTRELSRLNIELDEASTIISSLQPLEDTIMDMERQNKKLDGMVREKHQEILRLKEIIQPMEHELQGVKVQFEGQIKQLKKEIKQKDKQLEEINGNNNQHQEDMEELKQRISTLQNQKNKQQKQHTSTKRDNDSLIAKNKQLQFASKSSSQQIVDFTITVNTLRDRLKENQLQTDQLSKVIREQDKKIQTLTSQKDKLDYDLAEALKKIKDRDAQLTKLKRQAEHHQKELLKLKDQFDAEKRFLITNSKNHENHLYLANEKVDELQVETQRLKEKLQKEVPLRKETEKKLRSGQTIIDELNERVAAFCEQIKKYQLVKEKQSKEKKSMKDELKLKELAIDQLQSKLRQFQDKGKQLTESANKQRKAQQDMEKKLKQKQKQLTILQSHLDSKDKQLSKLLTSSQSAHNNLTAKLKSLQEANNQYGQKIQQLARELAHAKEQHDKGQKSVEQKEKMIKQMEEELIQLHKRILQFEGKLQDLLQAKEKEQLDKREFTKKLKTKETELLVSKKNAMTREQQLLKELQTEQAYARSLQKQFNQAELNTKQLTKKLSEQSQLYKQLQSISSKESQQKSKQLIQFKQLQNTLTEKLRESQCLSIELQAMKNKNGYDLEMSEKKISEVKKEVQMVNNLKKAKEEDYEKRIKLLEQQIIRKDAQVKDNQHKITQLQDQMNKSNESAQKTIASLNSQIKQLTKKLSDHTKQNSQLAKELQQHAKDHTKTKTAFQTQKKTLSTKLQKAQTELTTLKQLKNALDASLLQKDKQLKTVQKSLGDQEKTLNTKLGEISRLTVSVEGLKLKERDLTTEKQEQQKRIDGFTQKYNQTKQQLQVLYSEYSLKEDELATSLRQGLKSASSLNKTLTQKQFEIESLASQITGLQNELALLKQHTHKQTEQHKKQQSRKKLQVQKARQFYNCEIQKLRWEKELEKEGGRKLRKEIELLEGQLSRVNLELSEEEEKELELKKLKNEETRQKKDVEKVLRVKQEELNRLKDLLQAKQHQLRIFKQNQLKHRQSLTAQRKQKQSHIKQLQLKLTQKQTQLLNLKQQEHKLTQQHTIKLLAKQQEMFKLKEQLKIMQLEMGHLDKLAQIDKGEKDKLVRRMKEMEGEVLKVRKDAGLREGKMQEEVDKRERIVREMSNVIAIGEIDRKNLQDIIDKLNSTIQTLHTTIDTRDAQLSSHSSLIHDLKLQLQYLSTKLALAQAQNTNLSQQLSKEKKNMQKLIKDKEVQLNKLTIVVNKKDTQFLTGNKKVYQDLQRVIKENIDLGNQLTAKTIQLNAQIHSLTKDKQSLNRQLADNNAQLVQQRTQNDLLKNKLQQSNKQKSIQQTNHKKRQQDLQTKIRQLTLLSDDKQAQNNLLLNEISKLNTKLKSLQDYIALMKNQQTQTQNQILLLQTHNAKLAQQNQRLKAQLKLVQDGAAKSKRDYDAQLKRLSTQLLSDQNQKTQEIARLHSQLQDLRKKNIQKETHISTLTQANTQLTKKQAQHNRLRAKQQKQLKNLQSRIKSFQHQIDKLVQMLTEFSTKQLDYANSLNAKDIMISSLEKQLRHKDGLLGVNNSELMAKIEQLTAMIDKQTAQNRENARLLKNFDATNKDLIEENAELMRQIEELKQEKAKDKNQKKDFMKTNTKVENQLLLKQNTISKFEAEIKILKENLAAAKTLNATKFKELQAQIKQLKKQLNKKQTDLTRAQNSAKSTQKTLKQQIDNHLAQIQTINSQLLAVKKQRDQLMSLKGKQLEDFQLQVKELEKEVDSLANQTNIKDDQNLKERQKILKEKTLIERKLKDHELQLQTLKVSFRDIEEKNKILNSYREKELAEKRQLTELTLKKEKELEKMKEDFIKTEAELIKGQVEQKSVRNEFTRKLKEREIQLANLRRALERKDVDITRMKEKEQNERKSSLSKVQQKQSDIVGLRQKVQLLEARDKESTKTKQKQSQQLKTTIYQLNLANQEQQRLKARLKEAEQRVQALTGETKKKQAEIREWEQRLREKDIQLANQLKPLQVVSEKLKVVESQRSELEKDVRSYQETVDGLETEIEAMKKERQAKNKNVDEIKQALAQEKAQKDELNQRLRLKEKQLTQHKQSTLDYQSNIESGKSQISQLNKQLTTKQKLLERLQTTQKQLEQTLVKQHESTSKSISEINIKLTNAVRDANMLRQDLKVSNDNLAKEKKHAQTQKMLLLNKLKEKDGLIEKIRGELQAKEMHLMGRVKKLQEEIVLLKSRLSEKQSTEKQLLKDIQQKVLDSKIHDLKSRLAQIYKPQPTSQSQIQSQSKYSNFLKLKNKEQDSSPKKDLAADSPLKKLLELEIKVKELEKFRQIRHPDTYKKQEDEFNAQRAQLNVEIKQLKEDVQNKERQNETKKQQLTRKQTELAKLRESLQNYQRQLSEAKQNWDRSEKQKNQLQQLIDKQAKRITFYEARQSECKEMREKHDAKEKELQELRMRLNALLIELEIIEKDRARGNKKCKSTADQLNSERFKHSAQIQRLREIIEIKQQQLQKLIKELESHKTKNKDITILARMIERCRVDLLDLYQQLMRKDKELQKWKRTRGEQGVHGDDQNAQVTDTDVVINLHKELEQKEALIVKLRQSTTSKPNPITRLNKMTQLHKQEILHLHTQLRHKYEYFTKNNRLLTNADDDVESLKAELESAQTALTTQQKIFYLILEGDTASQVVAAMSVNSTAQLNNQQNSIQLNTYPTKKITSKGAMFLQLMDKQCQIAQLKRVIHEHLIISSQRIDPRAQASQNLSQSVENGINASFVNLVENDFVNSRKGGLSPRAKSIKEEINNFSLNSITEEDEEYLGENGKVRKKKSQPKEQTVLSPIQGKQQTARSNQLFSLESLMPEFFQSRPSRSKSTDPTINSGSTKTQQTNMQTYREYKSSRGSKNGAMTVESIVSQYYGKGN